MTSSAKKPRDKASKEPQTAKRGGRSVSIVWIVFGIIGVALVAAVAFSSNSEPDEYGTVEIAGDALPLVVDTPVDNAATGMMAPEIAGADYSGDATAIQHDGTPKAVVFLAHWCPHCQAEVPKIQSWIDETGGVAGVELVSVSTFVDPVRDNHPPSSWLEGEGWTTPVIADDEDSSAMLSYGGSSVPFWVFLDANGAVVARVSGSVEIDMLEGFLTELAG